MQCIKRKNKGQSLIEVIVAVGMISLLLTAVLALVSLSVKNSRLAKDRTKAVDRAQEGIELMRTYRDLSWTDLMLQTGASEYNLPEDWTVLSSWDSPCVNKNIESFFKRCVVLTDGGETVSVSVTVSWPEGNQTHKTVQETNLTLWER